MGCACVEARGDGDEKKHVRDGKGERGCMSLRATTWWPSAYGWGCNQYTAYSQAAVEDCQLTGLNESPIKKVDRETCQQRPGAGHTGRSPAPSACQ
jgi:hypothetical protein